MSESKQVQEIKELRELIRFMQEKQEMYLNITAENLEGILSGAGIHPVTKKRVMDYFMKTAGGYGNDGIL